MPRVSLPATAINGLWPEVKMRFIRFHDQVYMFNGRNAMRAFTGTGFRSAGIIKPAKPGGTILSAGAAGNPDGLYYYFITAANTKVRTGDERFVESLPMDYGSISVSNQKVLIVLPGTHPDPQVTHWIIYRNKNGSFDVNQLTGEEEFLKVATVAIGTIDATVGTYGYVDNVADDSLEPRPTLSFNAERAPAFKYGCVYANTFIGCGYDPFETGTASLLSGSLTDIEISGVDAAGLPDGLSNAYFQKKGEDKRYLVLGLLSSKRLRIDASFQGQLSGSEYRIFQDQSLFYYAEQNDAEKWGPELDWNQQPVGGPGSKLKLTGCFAAHGVCYIFTLDQVYRMRGTGPDDFELSQQAIIEQIGCVSSWTCVLVEGTLYWLSLKGPVAFNPDATGEQGFARIGMPLGETWADDLNVAQLGLAEAGYDPVFHRIKWALPLSGENVNGTVIVYDIRTGTWWTETQWGPNLYWNDYDVNGKPRLYSAIGRHMFIEDEGHNDGVPGGDKTGTVTGYAAGAGTTGVLTCSAAAFWTTGLGLEDRWAKVYRTTNGTISLLGKSKISSNTATALTLGDVSDFSSAPAAGDTVYVGAVSFRWVTKTFAYPQVNQRSLDFIARFALQSESTASKLWYRTLQNQTRNTGIPAVTVDMVHKELPSNAAGPEVALEIEVRQPDAKVALRSLTLETNPRGGQE